MSDLFGSLGLSYAFLFRLAHHLGQRSTALIGVGVIIALAKLNGGDLGDAIPYGTLWVMGCATSYLVSRILPKPAAVKSRIPTEQALPPSTLAVSITPDCPPSACPDEATMKSRLPPNVRALLS